MTTTERVPARTTASSRRSPWQRYGWVMAAVWLGFLYFPIVELLESAAAPWATALGWAMLVAFGTSYLAGFVFGMRDGWHQPARVGVWFYFAALLSAALTIPAIGWEVTSFLPFIMAYASYVLGHAWHWVTSAMALVLMSAYIGFETAAGNEVPVLLLAIVLIMFAVNSINVWLIGRSVAADELRLDLATVQEREEVARDVHDLLGHSLTIVKLKAELAIRLIEKDPASARKELEEITRLTSEAIAGVRSTVTGLRTESLGEQLRSSAAALESAGIRVTTSGEVSSLSPAQSLPAAWVLREATTNVLRHSQASRVKILFLPGTMTVEDNGIGLLGRQGNGLLGMSERAAAAGAILEIKPAIEAGTKVSLTW